MRCYEEARTQMMRMVVVLPFLHTAVFGGCINDLFVGSTNRLFLVQIDITPECDMTTASGITSTGAMAATATWLLVQADALGIEIAPRAFFCRYLAP
jgi:uncharacterized membrane protein YeiH